MRAQRSSSELVPRTLDTVQADTMTPMVKLGLEVVEFDVDDAVRFAREITSKNLYRISIAKGEYAVALFSAAYSSGMCTGAMAERRR